MSVRALFVLALIASAVVLVVAAVVFKSVRAKNALKFIRNVAWAYIIVIVGLAIYRAWTGGLPGVF